MMPRLAVSSAALCLALAALPAAAAEIGTIVRFEGSADVITGSTAEPARVGLAVDETARVRTAETGKVLIAFDDGSTLAVAPSTDVSLAGLAPASGGALSGFLELVTGAIRVLAAPAAAERRLEVRTGAGVAAVRSTEFFVEAPPEAMPEAMAVFVWEGAVAVSPTGSDHTLTLSPGEGVDIRRAEGDPTQFTMPDAPVVWGAPRVADAEARTRVE